MELVLISPFLLLILLMIRESAHAMLIKQDVVVTARSVAWNKNLSDQCDAAFTLGGKITAPLAILFSKKRSSCDATEAVSNGGSYWQKLERAGVRASKGKLLGLGANASGITRDVRKVESPQVVTATTRSSYSYRLGQDQGRFSIGSQHSLSANRYWTSAESTLKFGYDRILREKLGSRGTASGENNTQGTAALFPNMFFPTQSSGRSSGAYKSIPGSGGNTEQRMRNSGEQARNTARRELEACNTRNRNRPDGVPLENCTADTDRYRVELPRRGDFWEKGR